MGCARLQTNQIMDTYQTPVRANLANAVCGHLPLAHGLTSINANACTLWANNPDVRRRQTTRQGRWTKNVGGAEHKNIGNEPKTLGLDRNVGKMGKLQN